MLELNELLAYESGIRLTQAVTLLSTEQHFPNSEIESALQRLELSSSKSCKQLQLAQLRLAQISKDCVDRWISRKEFEGAETLLAEFQRRLNAASRNHITLLEECDPAISKWFRLGTAIAQGGDETWSDGQPQFEPRQYPEGIPQDHRLPYPKLAFINPVPPCWEWQDARLVEELVNDLGQSRDRLFPARRAIEEGECSHFSGLPFRHFWGWNALELGLSSLAEARACPCWIRQEGKLFLGDREIHKYPPRADNQKAILDAFQASGWQKSIPCPIADPKKASRTIDDLKRTLAEGPIHFRGGISGVSWEIRSV